MSINLYVNSGSNPPIGSGEWNIGLCFASCSALCVPNGCGICCCAMFCPCIQFGYNYEKVTPGSCFQMGCLWALTSLVGCCCFVATPLRKTIRRSKGIPEGCCGDTCEICFCPVSAVIQEGIEISSR